MKSFVSVLVLAGVAFAQHVSLFNSEDCSDTALDFDLGQDAHEVCVQTPPFTAVKSQGGLQRWDCIWMCPTNDCKDCLEMFSTLPGQCSNTYWQDDGETPLTYNAVYLQEC